MASRLALFLYGLFCTSISVQSSPATSPSCPSTTTIQLPRSDPPRTAVVSVTGYGASGDGKHYDTHCIQKAIDDCARAGGGRVRFPAGSYLTGTIFLRSGVVLEVEKGAKILGGAKERDYPADSRLWYVVVAENATEVGITGEGEINGQGWKFVERMDPKKNVMVSWNGTGKCYGDECRPRLVGFLDSRNVGVWNINLIQPAYWCLHIVRCNNTSIHDVSIHGDFNSPNNDGIDIEDSNNTAITRCKIDTGDDAICPKTSAGPLYNLTATDCWIRTKSCAIKLGSASWFDFKGLLFNNITITDSHRGLGFQMRDGGNVSDVTFSNIKISTRYYDPSWWGRAEPIYVTTCPRDLSSKVGFISDILFINISAESENGIFLSGSRGGILRNLKFVNVNLSYKRWTNYPGGLIDYRPGCSGLVHHNTAGMIMEHISGLELENMSMKWSQNKLKGWNNPLDFRPSTVNNVSFLDFHSYLYKM